MLSDLRSKRLIVLKGVLFAAIVLLCAAIILNESRRLSTLVAVLLLSWASARFYYFLFYVLHQYVDPSLKYDGFVPMLRQLWRRRRPRGPR